MTDILSYGAVPGIDTPAQKTSNASAMFAMVAAEGVLRIPHGDFHIDPVSFGTELLGVECNGRLFGSKNLGSVMPLFSVTGASGIVIRDLTVVIDVSYTSPDVTTYGLGVFVRRVRQRTGRNLSAELATIRRSRAKLSRAVHQELRDRTRTNAR